MTFLIASISPAIIFMYLIYRKDITKEPLGLLAKCFFGGFISILIAITIDDLITMPLGKSFTSPFLKSFYEAYFVAGFPEEFAKFYIVYRVAFKNKAYDQYYDGIIYAVFTSLGFAMIENMMYVYQGGLSVALTRAVLSVPGHGFFGVIMGYYLSLARFHEGNKRTEYLAQALFIPAIIHGTFDFLLMYAASGIQNPFLIIGLLIGFTLLVIKLWRIGFNKIYLHHQKDKNIQSDTSRL